MRRPCSALVGSDSGASRPRRSTPPSKVLIVARDAIDAGIFTEVASALDPQGTIRAWRQQSIALAKFLPAVNAAQQMVSVTAEMEELLLCAARANQQFSPLGWGVANMPVPVLQSELRLAEDDLPAAERALADAWTSGHVDRGISRMKAIYARMEPDGVSDVRRERWNLVQEAKRLHFEERYRASVPLILANIEGFVADAEAGRLFFTVKQTRKMDMHDPQRLSGMVCALTTLHALYTTGVGVTTAGSVLSRHGIMHGRVLGYGDKVTSAKCLTLFDAVADVLI